MFVKRLVSYLTLFFSIVLTVICITIDREAPPARTIDKDICRLVPDGRIDTGFVRTASDSDSRTKPENYIFWGKYYWVLRHDLMGLVDRVLSPIDLMWPMELHPLQDLSIAFSVEYTLIISSFFIKLNPEPVTHRFDDISFYVDDYKSWTEEDPEILNSSVAFWLFPDSFWYENEIVLFISQHYLVNGSVERNYYFKKFDDKRPDNITEHDREIPEFIRQIDSKYWIKAVLQVRENIGIIFLEYNGIGLHCHFNRTVNSCANEEMITENPKLFGCREPEPTPEFKIKEFQTTPQKPSAFTPGFKELLFGTFYKIVVIILVIIIMILFLVLPFIQCYRS